MEKESSITGEDPFGVLFLVLGRSTKNIESAKSAQAKAKLLTNNHTFSMVTYHGFMTMRLASILIKTL
ncbi:MAG: hypothetical protein MJK04_19925, partial [Psychrosphaera sp.]|nr:hypothetical protein [Psychrosphaera sp.]